MTLNRADPSLLSHARPGNPHDRQAAGPTAGTDGAPARDRGVRKVELTEFLQAAQRLGFAPDQFVVSAYDAAPSSDRQPGRVISVHRGRYARDFETFPGHGWCEPAIAALRAGHFGAAESR